MIQEGQSVGSSRSVKVKKNILASVGIRGVSMLVSFALVPLTIGYVSSEMYGVWIAISSVLTWLCFLDIGFSQGLKNRLTEAIAKDEWKRGKALVSTTYFLMVLIFVPVCLVMEGVIPLIDWTNLLNVSSQYEQEIRNVMYVLVAFACLQMVVNVLLSVIAAFQKVALSSIFVPLGNVISLVIIYVLTKTCPPSLMALAFTLAAMPILVTIIATVVFFCGQFKKVSPSIKCIDLGLTKDLFSLGYKFFIINIQVVVLYQSTNILISHVSSPYDVTNYNVAYRLLSCAMMAYTIITAPLWPAYTDAYTRGDFDWIIAMRKKMYKVLLLSVLGCVLITLCSPIIYSIWLGDKVEVPFIMTALVAIYVSVYCWMNLNSIMVVAMSKLKLHTFLVLIGMFVHIPISLYWGHIIGAYGVLASLIIINIFYAVTLNFQVRKILNKTAWGIWNQ